ncbi:hypothetical protein JCM10213_002729 [Rhodosporidiobolus nylandii]
MADAPAHPPDVLRELAALNSAIEALEALDPHPDIPAHAELADGSPRQLFELLELSQGPLRWADVEPLLSQLYAVAGSDVEEVPKRVEVGEFGTRMAYEALAWTRLQAGEKRRPLLKLLMLLTRAVEHRTHQAQAQAGAVAVPDEDVAEPAVAGEGAADKADEQGPSPAPRSPSPAPQPPPPQPEAPLPAGVSAEQQARIAFHPLDRSSWFDASLTLPPPADLPLSHDGSSIFDVPLARQLKVPGHPTTWSDIPGTSQATLDRKNRNLRYSCRYQARPAAIGEPFVIADEGDAGTASLKYLDGIKAIQPLHCYFSIASNDERYHGEVEQHRRFEIWPEDFAAMSPPRRALWVEYLSDKGCRKQIGVEEAESGEAAIQQIKAKHLTLYFSVYRVVAFDRNTVQMLLDKNLVSAAAKQARLAGLAATAAQGKRAAQGEKAAKGEKAVKGKRAANAVVNGDGRKKKKAKR